MVVRMSDDKITCSERGASSSSNKTAAHGKKALLSTAEPPHPFFGACALMPCPDFWVSTFACASASEHDADPRHVHSSPSHTGSLFASNRHHLQVDSIL